MASSLALPSSLFFFLLLALTSSPLPVYAARCNAADQKALLAIKAAFDNAYHFASWVPTADCCDWYGIDCDPSTGRVTGLSIFQDSNLTGTIPPAIADLPYLNNLLLHHLPKLTGPIPSALAGLHSISLFRIFNTGISGPVPAWISTLKSVTIIDLSYNALTGSAPASLSALSNLAALRLNRNKLSFDLSRVSFPRNLEQLDLSHNMIYGSIPAQINQLTDLAQFDVSYNQLCGAIPAGPVTSKFDQSSYAHNKCLCGAPLAACK